MAYGELIRVDAIAATALVPSAWAAEWMVGIAVALGIATLLAAWLQRRRGG